MLSPMLSLRFSVLLSFRVVLSPLVPAFRVALSLLVPAFRAVLFLFALSPLVPAFRAVLFLFALSPLLVFLLIYCMASSDDVMDSIIAGSDILTR